MILIIALLFSVSLLLLGMSLIPLLADRFRRWQEKKEAFLTKELDKTFYNNNVILSGIRYGGEARN